ncbi:hypothetical protein WJX75_001346 [Coccomyxa subellipsoidea]|uniref:Ribosome biogenesis protein BOP1 homolog n=1 Tax=Coccomyxa subellipsoidea TaxID=248742 RepID=A0ABR2YSR1_9CHLO
MKKRGLDSSDDEIDRAVLDLVQGGEGDGSEPAGQRPDRSDRTADAGTSQAAAADSDSSDDERPNRNTVGRVPLEWYRNEDHIGYDLDANKIMTKKKEDRLEALLARNDSGKALRTIYDEYNDEDIVLTRQELELVQRIREGKFPHVEVNPFEPEVDWFTRDKEIHSLSQAPEPKRRFMPSKWEEKKIVKLVRALRKGWIKTTAERMVSHEEPEAYLLWEDDGLISSKTSHGLSYLPATKTPLPGHAESYNPPKEYLPTEEEHKGWELADEEDRAGPLARAFPSLRQVPAYDRFINERFERCLDLYLCPRTRKKRIFVSDAKSLVPQLPKPRDLQPFPNSLAMRYLGHTAPVRSVAVDASGQWLVSGSDDGSVRLWEVATARCMRTWDLGARVHCVAWCPAAGLRIISAAVGKSVVLLPAGVGAKQEAASLQALQAPAKAAGGKGALCKWQPRADGEGLELMHQHPVKHVTWHARGEYFASVAPTGNTQAVLVHQLSKQTSQNPFRKNRGRVVRTAFHPSKPFFFVATQNHVRIYNLAKQALAKKLLAGSGVTCLAVHPSGDHVIIGGEDKRLAWFDLDLSTKPYRSLRYHSQALRGVAFHARHPLFASASDDGAVNVFHGMVYQDLLTNPLIVPVKILRGHEIVQHEGVLDCAFHPSQPWLFTAGADATLCLFTNQ